MNKKYIGDGVYADFNGYEIVLTAEDGTNILNTIYLDPGVLSNLVAYQKYLAEKRDEASTTQE